MALSFPSNPTTNQTYTYNGVTWTYNGTTWTQNQTATLTGTTVSTLQPSGSIETGSVWFNPSSSQSLVYNGTAWVSTSLPLQTGHNGQYLTTDGTAASWATVNSLPAQTGNTGKYLTTDGTTAAWATVTSGLSPARAVGMNLIFGAQ